MLLKFLYILYTNSLPCGIGTQSTAWICNLYAWTTASLPSSGRTMNRTFSVAFIKKRYALFFPPEIKFYYKHQKPQQIIQTQPTTAHTLPFLTLKGEGPHIVIASPVVGGSWSVKIPWRGQDHLEACFNHPSHFTEVTAFSPYLHH